MRQHVHWYEQGLGCNSDVMERTLASSPNPLLSIYPLGEPALPLA